MAHCAKSSGYVVGAEGVSGGLRRGRSEEPVWIAEAVPWPRLGNVGGNLNEWFVPIDVAGSSYDVDVCLA